MPNPAKIDEYSLSSVPITLLCKEAKIGSATGFFYRRNGKLFLVSNWHVFSGRNPRTGQSLRADAALPDVLSMPLHRKDNLGQAVWGSGLKLENDDGSLRWMQHVRGQDIDVAVYPLTTVPDGCVVYDLPFAGEVSDMALQISTDTFILGFPKGISNNGILPVWKRASVATEPDLMHERLPVFLVDTATREGMSGAPVVARSFGRYTNTEGGHIIGGAAYTRFVGVYSGRFGADDELGAQLGRVWHRTVIDEIIDSGAVGNYELR